jgi:hypothetical protein
MTQRVREDVGTPAGFSKSPTLSQRIKQTRAYLLGFFHATAGVTASLPSDYSGTIKNFLSELFQPKRVAHDNINFYRLTTERGGTVSFTPTTMITYESIATDDHATYKATAQLIKAFWGRATVFGPKEHQLGDQDKTGG